MPGTITFKPLEVNLTSDKSLFGKPEPFCVVSLGNQKVQTQIIESEIELPQPKHYPTLQVQDEPTCLIELKDQDNLHSEKSLGTCHVSLDEIESRGSLKRWYSIYNNDKPTGKILLETTFTQENQTPTDLPTSPEDRLLTPEDRLLTPEDKLLTPEDKLMTPEDSDDELRWTDDHKATYETPSYAYKHSEQPDDLLDEQLSPVEIVFEAQKKRKNKKGRFSLNQKLFREDDLDGSFEEYKTDLEIDLQKYKPRLSVVYRSHPLEMEDESPTHVEPAKKSKSHEAAKTDKSKEETKEPKSFGATPEGTPGMDEVNANDLYRQIMGSRWDL